MRTLSEMSMTVGGPLSPFLGFLLMTGEEKDSMTASRFCWVIPPSNLSTTRYQRPFEGG
jgi:hypothetical protein